MLEDTLALRLESVQVQVHQHMAARHRLKPKYITHQVKKHKMLNNFINEPLSN